MIGWEIQPLGIILLISYFHPFPYQVIEDQEFFSEDFLSWINHTTFIFTLIGLLQRIFLWSFSFYWTIIDCWFYCSHSSYQHSFILILVLGCVRKLCIGSIQTRHTDFLFPQDLGRLWRGRKLGVHTYYANWFFFFI